MTRRGDLATVLVAVAALGNARGARAQDRADVAWNDGALVVAESLYAERLAVDSNDQRALHRLGLIYAWSGRHAPAVGLLDRLVAIAPENLEARRDRARVLSWSGDLGGSAAAYRELLARRPDDRESALGLARVLSWDNRLRAAAAAYRGLLARDPDDRDALKGLARVRSWSGDLPGAEAGWRRAVALDSTDLEARAGLAQTLRWQHRHAAAGAALYRLPDTARRNPDVRRERRELGAVIGPRPGVSVTYELDSDENRITTLAASAGWRPALPVDLVAGAYYRRADLAQSPLEGREARGARLDARVFLDPGWVLSAGLGRSWSDVPGADGLTGWSAGASSPSREPFGASVEYGRWPLDATVRLIERRVEVAQGAVGLRFDPVSSWSATAGASRAVFHGTEPNRRLAGAAAVTRRLPGRWAVGAGVRAFGFDLNLDDGYFDPDFYGLAEAFVRWRPALDGWELSLEAAPGAQQVGSGGTVKATARAAARVARALGPGREVGLGAVFMTSGLQSFASGASDYRYFAVTLSGTWALSHD